MNNSVKAKVIFDVISLQNDDIETDLNKLRPKQIPVRPFDELRPFEQFFPEFSEDFQVGICLLLHSLVLVLKRRLVI